MLLVLFVIGLVSTAIFAHIERRRAARREADRLIDEQIAADDEMIRRMSLQGKVGLVDGEHYTAHLGTFRELRLSEHFEEAETLGLRLIAAVEEESAATGLSPAPGYYEDLAKMYRKQKRFRDEVNILERYGRVPGAGSFAERISKARALAEKTGQ